MSNFRTRLPSARPVSRFAARKDEEAQPVAPAALSLGALIFFFLLHAPLMLIFRVAPLLATLHSILVVLLGGHFLFQDKKSTRVLWVLAYISGAELLWRGVNAAPLWEYGKYASILLALFAILKYRFLQHAPFWAILFILLLLPGILVAPSFDRQAISFQLAGPVALALLSIVFGSAKINKAELQRLLAVIIAPTLSMAVLIVFIGGTQQIGFSAGGANEEITGGIGANQVTSALSLGALAAFFYALTEKRDARIRYLTIGLALFLISASVITFSRAGLWNAVGAFAVAILFLLRDRFQIAQVFNVMSVLALLGYFVIFPFLTNYTGGAMLARFSDFDSTGRDVLIRIDYQLFLDHPVLGVGVGQSPYYHIEFFGYAKPTHTEYGRLIAEHGLLGVAIMLIMFGVVFARLFSSRPPLSKALSLSLTIWALIYMAHAATRLVAPSFAFALGAAHFTFDDEPLIEDKFSTTF